MLSMNRMRMNMFHLLLRHPEFLEYQLLQWHRLSLEYLVNQLHQLRQLILEFLVNQLRQLRMQAIGLLNL